MVIDEVRDALATALDGRRLLDHPFYVRWEAGELSAAELGAYAEQYRPIEQALPGVLGAIADGLADGPTRDLVLANLADELGTPEPHADLFERFAGAVGARSGAAPTAAASAVVEAQRAAASSGPVAGLAALAAYEVQAAEVAETKGSSLRRHYGCDRQATSFWDVHATMEPAHADWTVRALAALAPDPADVAAVASAVAGAWWGFLDERQAQGQELASVATAGV